MPEILWKVLEQAKIDASFKQALFATKMAKDPALALCQLLTEHGFPITVGELFTEGETYCDNLLKSCNGGATYPREGWGDSYDLFFASLEKLS